MKKILLALSLLASFLVPVPALATPATPANLTVTSASPNNTATDQAIANVTWSAVSGAIFYRITATASGIDPILEQVPGNLTAWTFPSTRLAATNTGLTGGTTYNFTIKAVASAPVTQQNSTGEVESVASAAQTLLARSVPAAPTVVSAVAGVGQVTLTWTAPSNTGGFNLGNYKITATGINETAASTATSKVITGLTAGSEYVFSISATNTLGDSRPANFASVTVPKVPDAPNAPTATVSGTKITASWVAPTNNGGSTVTGYKAYLINASGTDVGNPVAVTTTSAEFTDVATGTYTVKVVATNIVGDSARSTASSGVTVSASSSLLANDPVITTTPANLTSLEIDKTAVVSATAPSQGSITYSATSNPAGACGLENNTVTAIAEGTCTITASVDANSTYNSGVSTKTFNITKKPQTIINFADIPTQTLPGPLVVTAGSTSGLTVSFTAAPTNVCQATGTNGATITFAGTGTCTVTAQQAGNATFAAAPNVQKPFTINAAAGGGGGTGGGGGGGGGGAGPKQTALYFKIVDPDDETKIWSKRGCVSVYSRDLSPQFLGSGCADETGNINILSADARVSIRVYEFGYGAIIREYFGVVGSDTFTIEGGKFFAGTTRWAVTVPKSSTSPTPTPTPTPVVVPSPTPTPTPTSSPTPTPTPTPTPSPTPSASPSPTVTPTPTPSVTPSPTVVASTYYSVTKSTKGLAKVTVRSSKLTTNSKVGRSIQAVVSSVGGKAAKVTVTLKTPDRQTFTLAKSVAIKANKGYSSPIIRFLKAGTYTITVKIGSSSRTITAKVLK